MQGITKGGLSHGERNRDRQRQKGRKPQQPTLLFLYLRCVTLGTGETDGHVVAEVKNPIVPPAGYNRSDGQLRPMRKSACDQPAHEATIDLYARGRGLSRSDFCRVVRPLHLRQHDNCESCAGKWLRNLGQNTTSAHGVLLREWPPVRRSKFLRLHPE